MAQLWAQVCMLLLFCWYDKPAKACPGDKHKNFVPGSQTFPPPSSSSSPSPKQAEIKQHWGYGWREAQGRGEWAKDWWRCRYDGGTTTRKVAAEGGVKLNIIVWSKLVIRFLIRTGIILSAWMRAEVICLLYLGTRKTADQTPPVLWMWRCRSGVRVPIERWLNIWISNFLSLRQNENSWSHGKRKGRNDSDSWQSWTLTWTWAFIFNTINQSERNSRTRVWNLEIPDPPYTAGHIRSACIFPKLWLAQRGAFGAIAAMFLSLS